MGKKIKLQIVDKKSATTSYKWSVCPEGCRPYGIADMDIKTDERIRKAMSRIIQEGDFGYSRFEDYYESVLLWMKRRYHWEVKPEWLTYAPGIMIGITLLMELLTSEGDEILVFSPVYNGFYAAIEDNKRTVKECPLVYDGRAYKIDFEQFEHGIRGGAKLLLVCSPHNPIGRSWTKEEIIRIKDICKAYQVPIISDEIHADVTLPPNIHTPFLKYCEDYKTSIYVGTSPSKAFNIESLYIANYVIPNATIRNRFQAILHGEPNVLSSAAVETAYVECEDWLQELCTYIKGNIKLVQGYLEKNGTKIKVIETEATYMMWLDCRALGLADKELEGFFREKARMDINVGSKFGKAGRGFIRMNIACERRALADSLVLLCNAIR